LVPVEEWDEHQNEETEIDLVELAKYIWDERFFIAKVTGVFVIIGLLVALLSPKEYQTDATLMPEVQSSKSGAAGLLQQYGGLIGMSGNLNTGQQGSISPQLYPTIIQSLPFQLELLNKKVNFSEPDTTVSVYTYFNEMHSQSVFSYALEFTIGLPGKIIGLFKGDQKAVEQQLPKGFETDTVYTISKNQMAIVKDMRRRISVSLNKETGILTLTVKMPDPKSAAGVGQVSIALLKDYMKNYQTQKAMEDLEFAQKQLERAKDEFEQAQNKLAEFRDSNINLATAKAQTREQKLQSHYDLAFNVYNSLAQRVEQAKMKVQEQTPVVSILQPLRVPLDDMTSGYKILISLTMLGLLFSLFLLYVNNKIYSFLG